MNTSKSLDLILDRLQARDFYDAIQAVEKLGASEDFTAAVTVLGKYLKLYGYHVTTRKEAKQAIVEAVEGLAPKKKPKMSYAEACKDFKLMEIATENAGYNKGIDDFLQAIKEWQDYDG